ncbi:DUF58 domain-containing protein [Flavobacterium agrisoli]|uniref:DUF58 domain-containing protein n=1 Tax=Flavobacterium agrisoli TaxID=2793066 RepID=A0A934PM67_9FLAO|nr:DUF58 domain-containing protein [Flavobacterium agrisoli]MBK0370102.1 DUF58 domain-containing protein [Flavobacterium agrisoli]
MDSSNKSENIFLTLEHLLKFEWLKTVLNFNVGQQKSKSVFSGRYASRLRGRGLDFEEARPYVIGDDIRNIDWKVTAKTGSTHTKVFTEEKEKPAFIFVDQSETMGFGSVLKTKAVVAGELAAIAAYKILKGGDRIGGMVSSGATYDIITPKRGQRNMLQFFEKIVNANQEIYNQKPFDYGASLKEMIAKLENVITHDFLVIVISDFHNYHPTTLQYLSFLSQHNDVVLIKIFDPMEEHIPDEKISLTNRNKQITVGTKNTPIATKLKDDFKSNYERFREEVEKYGITLFKINTVDTIEEQLINWFSQYKPR